MREKIIINTDVELDLPPKTVAELFWNFDSDEQAQFFNALGDNQQFQWQMNQVALSSELGLSGAKAMTAIGRANG
jgi:hypothetical protein